ncbi:acetylcholine receptor subunit alpha-type acr-16-like [Littorina saxatilis]|uniref:Neurotransmitter-gated ion-channel ligand-binding domain-containing protein n=1 Tax=Littorina saxatilis TaxID=31220 RepID=A0AAN9AN03_9CAEN
MTNIASLPLLVLCTVLVWHTSLGTTSTASFREAVLESILDERSSRVRPDGPESGSPVSINISYSLTSISKVELSTGLFETVGYLQLQWKDPRLAFRSGFASAIRVDPASIWTPDIELYNSAPPGLTILNRKNVAIVYPSGEVLWIPMVALPSVCDMTSDVVPATFNCTLLFGSWTFPGFDVDVGVSHLAVELSDYIPNRSWEVVNTSASRRVSYYSCCPEPYPLVSFSIVIKQKA